jgi:hypothetical protein
MFIRLMKLFTVQNVTGPEMDRSALVTVLAETFLVPTYALQPYMTWTPIDSTSAKATIRHQVITVSGIFHFNAAGEATYFETNDRYMSQNDGSSINVKWYAFMNNYKEQNSIVFPSDMSAAWEVNGEKKEYGRLHITGIKYDVTTVEEAMMR